MKNSVEKNLSLLGFSIPKPGKPVGKYLPYIKEKKLLFISGQLPIKNGKVLFKGKIDKKKKNYGYKAAQLCAVNIIGQVNLAINGNFNKISKCINLGGFVNSNNNFQDHAYVMNGASDLFCDILKIKGTHTRFAVGANSLPLNASVEVNAIFSLK
mgnify:CR=1 FL=1